MIPEVEIYSDGGSNPNPGKGGYGVILHYKGIKKEFYQGFKFTTNNRMELTGAITGLEKLKTKSKVKIFTDSQYTINGIEKGWAEKWKKNDWYRTKSQKAVNYDLWEKLLDLTLKHDVKFHWVKGHNGHIENERCDELATLAMKMDNLLDDINYIPNIEELEKTTKHFLESKNIVELNTNIDKKVKITKPGDLCRKCNTPVEQKQPKKSKKIKPGTYYYEYYLSCPTCKTMYFLDEAKIYT